MAAAPSSGPCTDMVVKKHMFVLAAVGTDHHPFDRFVEWIDTWQSHNTECEVFIQRGSTDRVPNVGSAKWLDPAELDGMMRRADAIVCHGGPSTIMEARRAGVVPVVIPRDPTMGEHVDDHQIRFTKFMATKGAILAAQSEAELSDHLRSVIQGDVARITADSSTPTLDRISSVIEELMERPSRSLLRTLLPKTRSRRS
jgi:UDP-N-acetylglucosamine transferase subunit ALG13